ncbi:MAG: 4Fe-4S dicluster domain-containing protein [Planctomycetota bacterium]|nr:MAG: 4Fe-4S dicluster domain-containing protein [Planctomycetota bacterium]
METLFINDLKPLLDAVAKQMDLYVPKKSGDYYVFSRYDKEGDKGFEFNNIRTCTPIKEFLLPVCELAAMTPGPFQPEDIKPFAVFGLKDCDLRSIAILDKVFAEEEFKDPFYTARRDKMFIISSDCSDPAESCLCNIFDGQPFAESGFDLNVSKVADGFIVEAGSQNGEDFVKKYSQLFTSVPKAVMAERDQRRAQAQKQLQENNAELAFDRSVKDIVEGSWESEVFDSEAKNCIECQACTRICPTCHCFYLYDTKQKDYFAKMKMWDSCMRMAYAAVAGGANPNEVLGDRLKHRLMHKFVYFVDRYGTNMCVGCGRCVDAEAGGIDLREVLKKLSHEQKGEGKKKARVAK